MKKTLSICSVFLLASCIFQLPARAQSPLDSMRNVLEGTDLDSAKQEALLMKAAKLMEGMHRGFEEKLLGQPFPDFELPLLQGDTIRKRDLLGKKVFLNFWFADCQPCIDEMPLLNELKAGFAEGEIVFLAVTFEPEERVHRFLQRHEFDFKHVLNGRGLAKEVGVKFYPATMILDESGLIMLAESGAAHIADPEAAAAWKRRIEGLLREE